MFSTSVQSKSSSLKTSSATRDDLLPPLPDSPEPLMNKISDLQEQVRNSMSRMATLMSEMEVIHAKRSAAISEMRAVC